MSSGYSAIAKNTLFLYLRMAITMGVGLYTSRVVLNILGVEDFGVYVVVGGVVSLFGFLNSAMSTATQRFFAVDIGADDKESLNKTFNASLVIHIGIALIVLLVAESIGLWILNNKLNLPIDRIDTANFVYQFSILSSMLAVIQVPFNALIIARERMGVFAAISLLEAFLKLSVVYLLYLSSDDRLLIYAVLVFFSTVLISVTYAIYCRRTFEETRFRIVRGAGLYRTLIAYAGWNLFGNLAVVAKGQGINVLLNIFFGTAVNAAYGIMDQVQNAVGSFVANFLSALSPQIYKSYARDDRVYMHGLIFQGAKFSFFLVLIIICPIIYNITFVLDLWLINPPPYTDVFVVLILLNLLFECISRPLMIGALATGRIKWYQIILGTILFLNLPLSYVAFRVWNSPIAFLFVSLGVTLVTSTIRLFFLRSMIGLDIGSFLKKVILPVSVVLVSSGLFLLLLTFTVGESSTLLGFFQMTILISVILVLITYLLGINRLERDVSVNLVRKALKGIRYPSK